MLTTDIEHFRPVNRYQILYCEKNTFLLKLDLSGTKNLFRINIMYELTEIINQQHETINFTKIYNDNG